MKRKSIRRKSKRKFGKMKLDKFPPKIENDSIYSKIIIGLIIPLLLRNGYLNNPETFSVFLQKIMNGTLQKFRDDIFKKSFSQLTEIDEKAISKVLEYYNMSSTLLDDLT